MIVKIKNYKTNPKHWDSMGMMFAGYPGKTIDVVSVNPNVNPNFQYMVRQDLYSDLFWYFKEEDIEKGWIADIEELLKL